jgi:hypothetical protein
MILVYFASALRSGTVHAYEARYQSHNDTPNPGDAGQTDCAVTPHLLLSPNSRPDLPIAVAVAAHLAAHCYSSLAKTTLPATAADDVAMISQANNIHLSHFPCPEAEPSTDPT